MPCGDLSEFRSGQRLEVGGQQGESLVDQSVDLAELPDLTVPTANRVTSILNEAGTHADVLPQSLRLVDDDVADRLAKGAQKTPGRDLRFSCACSEGYRLVFQPRLNRGCDCDRFCRQRVAVES